MPPWARRFSAWANPEYAIRRSPTLPRIGVHLSPASFHPPPKSGFGKRLRAFGVHQGVCSSAGTQSPNHHESSRLRCAVLRPRRGRQILANQRGTGLSNHGATPFHSPTTGRKGGALCEPSAEPELLRTLQPSVFRKQDTRLKAWAELLGV